ncbi:hypothetical protein [Nocardia asteroides]|uniref:hypothetical protein n=1 Tax=Nocardia asteroides TaxID=1824 RepID=UPI0036637ED5
MRILVAPVTITPTKPIVPSHVKAFLWADLLLKATAQTTNITCLWNPRTPNLSGQAIGFWEYLDRTYGHRDYSDLDELSIGRLYVEFHSRGEVVPHSALAPYVAKVEAEGWAHPATTRMVELWSRQLADLGVLDPGLSDDRPSRWSVDRLVAELETEGLCLDHRTMGGPVYLDGTRWGVPLRTVISTAGHANYVATALRDILPHALESDHVLLVFDEEVGPDFILIAKLLQHFGISTSRLALGRVPVDGRTLSSRHGGWAGVSLSEIQTKALAEFSESEYRLAMRIYFISTLGRASPVSFSYQGLFRALKKARRLLDQEHSAAASVTEFIRPHITQSGWTDPYRLTTAVISRPVPRAVIDSLYIR